MEQLAEYDNECLISLYNIKIAESYLVRTQVSVNQYCYYYIFDESLLNTLTKCPNSRREIRYIQKVKLSNLTLEMLKIISKDQNLLFDHEGLILIEKKIIEQFPWTFLLQRTREDINIDIKNCCAISRYSGLKKIDLTYLNLQNAIFEFVDLIDINFAGSDLQGAKLVHVNISAADFYHCNLKGCKFAPYSMAGVKNLTVKQLSEANLHVALLANTLERKINSLAISPQVAKLSLVLTSLNTHLDQLKYQLHAFCRNALTVFNKNSSSPNQKAETMLSLADLEQKLDLSLAFLSQIDLRLNSEKLNHQVVIRELYKEFALYQIHISKSFEKANSVNNSIGLTGFFLGVMIGVALCYNLGPRLGITSDSSDYCASDAHSLEMAHHAGLFSFTLTFTTSMITGILSSIGLQKSSRSLLTRLGFFQDPIASLLVKNAKDTLRSVDDSLGKSAAFRNI